MKKAIVIGLDGLEPKITEAMLKAGELPNLARLREQGGYSRIRTTYPAQTPVAWSTFVTGTNPGGHGIFDFLSRDPKTYLPILGLCRYEQKNPFVLPKAVNLRRGTPLWELLSNAGIPSIVVRCPCTYPPDEIKGRMLAGVGVPDLRGGLGTSTYYTTNLEVTAGNSEKVLFVKPGSDGVIQTHLVGPRNPKTHSDFMFDITLYLERAARKLTLRSQGNPNVLEVREGQWSDWLKVKFKIGMMQGIQGAVRFYLDQIDPVFKFYASPINFDPQAPWFPISSPLEYSKELEARLGTYYTLGMAEDHDGLINGRFEESAFLEQCAIVLREREQMMLTELERFREGLFFVVFDTPDRMQHMFWRFHESDHPANRDGFSTEMASVIEEQYRVYDDIVGKAMARSDDQTLFLVLSDHGMNSFQRGLNLNTWLFENGFLVLKNGCQPGDDTDEFFHNVDWSRSKAYSLGLGCIFLNLRDREAQGILNQEQAEDTRKAITSGLTGLRDVERGEVAVRSVVSRTQVWSGAFAQESPDLLVNFSEGYRVSWGTPLGGIPVGLFEDNTKRWAGDHVIDPQLIPGVLIMNKKFNASKPDLIDMAPTILAALGMPKGPAMEGENILR